MYNLLFVALGGGIGAGVRYLMGMAALRLLGAGFPWGTVIVNILGSFAMGVLIELLSRRGSVDSELKLFLVTGILGGFTTFSAFSLDFVNLWERDELMLATVYVICSVALSIGALLLGLWLMRLTTV